MAALGVIRSIVRGALLAGAIALPKHPTSQQRQGWMHLDRKLPSRTGAETGISLAEASASAHLRGQPRIVQEPEQDSNQRWAKWANDALNANGVWNTAGAEANLCSDGKLLPAFYLLGGPKCATTSVAMELGMYGGIHAAPHLWSEKEWHFWEGFGPGADDEATTSSFRDALGECPDQRLVLGDFSINNLASVPKPQGMELSPCSCNESIALRARRHQVKGSAGGDVPRLLSKAYGTYASNLTLMMMLRSPLPRMQSSWYHAKAENFSEYWGFSDCCTTSFNDAMRVILGASTWTQDTPAFQGKLGGEGSVWTSMFGRHIEEYLKFFNPAQMIIVPYNLYMARESRSPICGVLRNKLTIGLDCIGHEDFHENIHPHPPLDEDIDAEVGGTLRKMFEPEQQRLVAALANASLGGAYLPGYSGPAGDLDEIESWLTNNW